MKKILIPLIVCILVFVAFFAFRYRSEEKAVHQHSYAEHADVVLTSDGFVPQEVYLKKHGTISFSTTAGKPFWPASDPHPVHSIYPVFDPRTPIDPGDTWTFTFDDAGTWRYHDHVRPYFTGVVYVEE